MSANTQSSIEACQSIIQSLVQERMQKMNAAGSHYGGGGGNPSQYSSSSSNPSQIVLLDGSTVPSHHSLVEVQVPDADVGLVIGKGGVTIKQIQEQSGANVHVPKSGNIDNPTVRTLQVTCPNIEGANLAKQLIEDVLKTKPGFGANGGMNQYQSQQQVSLQVSVPDKDVGLCIGRGGCVIKYMQSTTQTRIQIPPTVPNPGDIYRVITVTGPNMEACQQVQSMIHRILSEQSSAGVMSGNHASQPQQPYGNPYTAATSAQPPQINQPGYTAEWAAYHAAQQQQQQQQQQQVQYQETAAAAAVTAATQQAATTAAVPATNEYTEPFFRYAYYYGEEAARQYYGAWSPPVGTPNPYGINPNGITTPTATAATTTATTAVETANPNYGTTTEQVQSTATNAASAPTTTTDEDAASAFARETSRRHVSNLPAWMTKK